jgi:hypothetical protein
MRHYFYSMIIHLIRQTMKRRLLTTIAILGGLVSCQPEEILISQDPDQPEFSLFEKEVTTNEKFLEFSSFQAFSDSANLFSKLAGYERNRFEVKNNFVSLNRIFEYMTQWENEQYNREEQMIRTYPDLRKTMKHNFSPLTSHMALSIINNPLEGLTYRLFQGNYAFLLNKYRVVKIGGMIFQMGEDHVKIIQNGDKSQIEKLGNITVDNQTDNLKCYPVKKFYYNIQEKNVRANETVFCEKEIPNDLRLKAWTYGALNFFFNNKTNTWVHQMSISIEMRFTRKTWLGWFNHNSENYSSNGSWYASSYRLSAPLPHPPTVSQTYALAKNFQGKTSTPSHTFFYKEYLSPVYENLDFIKVGGTQNFQFVEMTCSNVH